MLPSQSKPKLLIVETEELFRRNIADRLRHSDYRVFEAAEVEDARQIVIHMNIDVVLLGLKGLRRRGLELLKAIKESYPTTEVILMAPSEEHSLSLSIEGMKLGAFNDLLIPFDVGALIRQIDAAHQKKMQMEEKGRLAGC